MGRFGECAGAFSAAFATFALLFSFLSSFWCQTFRFTPIKDPVLDVDDPDIHMSPWYQQTATINYGNINGDSFIWVNRFCVNYWVAPELDAYWKTVRAFSVLAILLGGLGTIALCCSCCFPSYFNADLWRSLALKFCVLVTLCQGLTLLIFRSNACTNNNVILAIEAELERNVYNQPCVWDTGSSLNVVAMVFWFLTGVLMLIIGPPEDENPIFSN